VVLANPSASDADPDIQECHRCKPVSCRPCRPDSSTERTRHRCRLYRCISIDTGSRAASHRNSKCGSRAGNGDHNLRRDRFTADWSSAKGCFSCFSLAAHAGCGVQSSWPEPIGNPKSSTFPEAPRRRRVKIHHKWTRSSVSQAAPSSPNESANTALSSKFRPQ